jgi:phage tail P2-like protein
MSKLLPPNATPLETALAAQADRINQIAVTFVAMHHIDTCPAPYLPWLAWANRVDFWQADWTDQQKRAAIAESKTFNQARGTSHALTYALAHVTANAQLVAWHQLQPKGMPFTFTVQLPPEQLYAIDELQTIHTAIDSAKSARDVYGVQARVRAAGSFFVAGATREGQRVSLSTLD